MPWLLLACPAFAWFNFRLFVLQYWIIYVSLSTLRFVLICFHFDSFLIPVLLSYPWLEEIKVLCIYTKHFLVIYSFIIILQMDDALLCIHQMNNSLCYICCFIASFTLLNNLASRVQIKIKSSSGC